MRMIRNALTAASGLIFLLGCMVNPSPVYRKNGHIYGVTSDYTYSEEWDSCYRRGLSYSRGGYWENAISEFLKAIRERPKDQWRARTFGMNILDAYFPHRELGIVYLHQGRTKEAIDELSLSLEMADSGKAKYHLNKAHQQWLQESGWDKTPPFIQFSPDSTDAPDSDDAPNSTDAPDCTDAPNSTDAPDNDDAQDNTDAPEEVFTNCSIYQLEGKAEDDFFVASVLINGAPLYYELARPTILFQEKIALRPGLNTITCQATDLMGHQATRKIKVHLDIQGPLVLVNPMSDPELPALSDKETPGNRIKGMVVDDWGLAKLIIDGEEIPLRPGGKIHIFELDLSTRKKALTFQAIDLAGNTTKGDFSWPPIRENHVQVQSGPIQVCDYSPHPVLPPDQRTSRRSRQPGLSLKIIDCPEVVFNSRIVIQGVVTSLTEISEVWINETLIFSGQQPACLIESVKRVWENLWQNQKAAFYFTYLYEGLKEEKKNRITIRAEDKEGRSVQKEMAIEYRLREVDKIGNRWQLAILPFDKYETDKPLLASSSLKALAYFDDLLWYCFDRAKRFSLVERELLLPIMREKRLQAYYHEINKKDLIRISKTLAVEVFLAGAMRVDWDGSKRLMEITGRLVDGESGEVLATQNVYNQWKTRQDEEYLLNGLVQKFVEEFPLAQGKVTGKNDEEFTINLGSDDFIKTGMKIIVFRQKETEQKILGEGRLTSVYEDFSRALPSTGILLEKTDVGDSIITK